MKIAVIGTGYVGLVVGACLAELGNQVICVDNDLRKIRSLRRGVVPIYEPGLAEIVKRNMGERRLSFGTSIAQAVRESLIIFVAVGTPAGDNGAADLQHVLDVARQIGRSMNGYKVIVNKSTVPVGTAVKVREAVRRETKHPFSVVSNPEFLKEGAALDDFMKPDRVVLGIDDERAASLMRELYSTFTRTGRPILMMDTASAELSKYAANAMLAARISFMNEIANVCELVGANVDQVRRVIGSDERIGPAFLFPGVGYGGSCFPKDVRALARTGESFGYEFRMLKAVEAVNEAQKERLIPRILAQFKGRIRNRVFAIWGLAFKPKTDDMREAPAITIIQRLLALGARIQAYDPEAEESARRVFGRRIVLADRSYEAVRGADALIIVTEWNEFREPDFQKIKKLMRQPVIFDGRNIYDPAQVRRLGFTYISIGRV